MANLQATSWYKMASFTFNDCCDGEILRKDFL